MNEGFSGEPMSVGARGKSRSTDLEARFTDGIDLAKIRSLLNTARERAGAPVERILTVNLIGIHYSDASWEKARVALEAVSGLHPARIVGLIALPHGDGGAESSESVVTARVAVTRPKGAAFFIERIVLRATGKAVRRLESVLSALLVPEVPVVVVWGGRAEGSLLKRAIDSADRLIVDSSTQPPSSLGDLNNLLRHGAPLGDLAWARIFPWQSLAAEVLDIPNLREHRGNIKSVLITTAGPPGAEAMLLAGWFQSRVKQAKVVIEVGPAPESEPVTASEGAGAAAAHDPAATPASTALDAALGTGDPHATFDPKASLPPFGAVTAPPLQAAPISLGQILALKFEAPPAVFELRREKNGILEAQVRGDDDGEMVHRLRLPASAPGALLVQELKLLAGCEEIYAAALDEAARIAAHYHGKETP